MKMKVILGSVLFVFSGLTSAQITPKYYDWMSGEVKSSGWDKGYSGQGTQIVTFDFFTTGDPFYAKLDSYNVSARHGSHVGKVTRLLAPNSTLRYVDYNNTQMTAMPIDKAKINIINASLGLFTDKDLVKPGEVFGNTLVRDMINHSKNGTAIIVKAAGNDAINMGDALTSGAKIDKEDGLNTSLITSNSVIYVGALSNFGNVANKASMASYSNKAGTDVEFQKRFLVTGVRAYKIGVGGTSMAAPIVSSYAAIVGSKFKTATPTQVANQLLNTARTDTVMNYDPSIYGKGEVSITRALAPVSLK